jgi:hypothetical protein
MFTEIVRLNWNFLENLSILEGQIFFRSDFLLQKMENVFFHYSNIIQERYQTSKVIPI